MQKGDLISIEFTGKELSTGKVFDTTSKDIAEKEGMPTQNRSFGPVVMVAGMGEVLKGLDDELLKMNVGDSKTVKLSPAQAFGARDSNMIKVLPLSEFKKNNVSPVPGTIVNANDMIGKVQSVSGGRVRVDFNGDLAGKEVEYTLKIVKHFKETKEQLAALTEKMFKGKDTPTVTHEGANVNIVHSVKGMAPYQRSVAPFAKMVLDTIKGVTKVRVTTEFEATDFKGTHFHENGEMHDDDAPHDH